MGLAPTADTYGSLIHSHVVLKRHQDAFNVVTEMRCGPPPPPDARRGRCGPSDRRRRCIAP
eukprot:1188577-Prorocentrum_minimum.AAC.2